ncbi:MAG: diaminopimelate decarboxylase, partial [Clostridia bacterium]|nr:diaminopimelate decarboxylase [Clostridia bacterium]
LVGLHCHIGSQIFEKNSFVLAVEKMTDFYKILLEQLNLNLEVIDLGGGFGIYYNEEDPKLALSDYEEYVKVICCSLLENVSNKGLNKPYLILEPGRSIVGEAGITLYTVGNVKEIKDVKKYVAIDGGMFENPRFALYQAKYEVVSPLKLNETPCEKYSIAGKCCESGDIIAENVCLPKIEKGDLLAVLSTGAYNYSMASNYNRNLIPPVVMVKDGKCKVVVKAQTYEDLTRNDL